MMKHKVEQVKTICDKLRNFGTLRDTRSISFTSAIYRLRQPTHLVFLLPLLLMQLSGCSASNATLSNVHASASEIVPGSSGIGKPPGALDVRYTVGKTTQVTAQLQGPLNATLLSSQQAGGDHVLRFTGIITDAQAVGGYNVIRRVVPAGDYTISLSAGDASQSVRFKVNSVGTTLPTLDNLVVRPDAISPNSDAVDDMAEVTFRTEQTSTVSVDLEAPNGKKTLIFAPQQKGPGEQNISVNGQDLRGQTLPDGAYTVTVQLQDRSGNRVQAQRPLKIEGGGEPAIEILKVEISPRQIILGASTQVTVTVKNVGNVPLRTQRPDPGYSYTTNDSYSSVESGKWVDRAGLWRVGVDWDGNSGGAAYRYPFRWGLGKTLMPGETAVTGGKITILKQERRMWFFAGILQEGVRIVRDRLGVTPVDVSF